MMNRIDLDEVAISTKDIVNGGIPILKVSHDEDDIWQFLDGSSELDESDAMVVSLGTMLQIDSTIKEILNLPLGSNAFRRDKNSNWVIANHN